MTAPTLTAGVAAYQVLDAAYRAAVAGVAVTVIQGMLQEWQKVEAGNLVGTSTAWLQRSLELIIAGQSRSRFLANVYTQRIRALSLPDASPWTPLDPPEPNVEQLFKSLVHTGIRTTGQELARLEAVAKADRERLREEFQADQEAAATEEARRRQMMHDGIRRAAAAAIRHITTAGQEQIYDNVMSDKLALGWVRTTKARCCYFCAMLASRGAVYKEDSFEESDARFTGPGDAKVHDTCGCGLRPIYSTDEPVPDQTDKFEQLWIDSTAGKSGADAIKAFRGAYDELLSSEEGGVS